MHAITYIAIYFYWYARFNIKLFFSRYELRVRYLPKNFSDLYLRDKVTFFYLYDQVSKYVWKKKIIFCTMKILLKKQEFYLSAAMIYSVQISYIFQVSCFIDCSF